MNCKDPSPAGACAMHHVAIQTADFCRAFWFYTELLGLSVVKAPFDFNHKRTLAWLDAGGVLIELYSVKEGWQPEPYCDRRLGADHIAFEFADLQAILDKLTRNGFTILKGPFLPPTGDPDQPCVAIVRGPDGEELELREPRGGDLSKER